jgi:murein DD-endopeptidase MepM/ murein hydrolase activator NlpD
LLNASVGVQRALARLLPATSQRSSKAITVQRHSLAIGRAARALVLRPRDDAQSGSESATLPKRAAAPPRAMAVPMSSRSIARSGHVGARSSARGPQAHLIARSAPAIAAVPPTARTNPRRTLIERLGTDRVVPAAAIAILLVAGAISSVPALGTSGPIGGPFGDGPEARLAAGAGAARSGPQGAVEGTTSDAQTTDDYGAIQDYGAIGNDEGLIEDSFSGPGDEAAADPDTASDTTSGGGTTASADASSRSAGVLEDGTILKPVAVDTTVTDGKGLMRTYRVRNGDTLTGIARKFDVSMMTVWWANHLRSKDDLHVGQFLTIPPVSGVVVTVGATDTLEALAAKYGVEPSEIVEANELDDPHLVIGQTLTVPGALGKGIVVPKPKPKPVAKQSSGGYHTSTKPPARYSGGKFAWPVAGGYISQYFHYGHYAIDIAADRGTPVKAAAAGTVLFAGWKNNGGGYQVWISHGSNLYTTYNHMSSISVGRGQHVGRGQQVGRVGMTGNATGPHLHFEVWRGPIWNGGTRVNPLIYL